MTRRKFLIGGATAAGALIVGYGLWPSRRLARANLLAAKPGERFVANWIKIANDDTVTVIEGRNLCARLLGLMGADYNLTPLLPIPLQMVHPE
jgi:hypothetical protein